MNGVAALIESLVYKIWMIRITISFKKDLKRICKWSDKEHELENEDLEDLKEISRCQKDLKKTSSRPQKGFNLSQKTRENRRKERSDEDYQKETQIFQNHVVESIWNVWIQCADDKYLYKY